MEHTAFEPAPGGDPADSSGAASACAAPAYDHGLWELFSPPSSGPEVVEHPLEMAAQMTAHALSRGLLPDAHAAAAWAWLQSRWLGRPAAALHAPADGQERWTETWVRPEGTMRAGDWVDRVDRARRSATAPTLSGSEPELLWGTAAAARGIPQLGMTSDGLLRLAGAGQHCAPEGARRWLETLAAAALALWQQPEAPLAEVPTLTAQDRDRQWRQWNPPHAAAAPFPTVHAAFAQQVRLRPDAVALVHGSTRWSYAQLQARAQAIASHLIEQGVQPGEPVGLLMERSPLAVAALLGSLQAGAAYVPLQADFPAERIAFMLRDAGIHRVMLRDAAPSLPDGIRQLPLARFEHAQEETSALPDWPAVDGQAPAYVMYTSGSTGEPKGIEISHRAILRLVSAPNYVELPVGEVVLHAAPLGFDASTFEIWGPLLNGGVCAVHDEPLPTGAGLSRSIGAHGVTTAWLTAALFNAVVDEDPAQLRGLRQLLTGGEALSLPHVQRAQQALPQTQIINGYGPTECTTFAASLRLPREWPADARSVPIGRPINDTTLRVLGPALAPLPTGFVGELCIGGAGLARGYVRRPELDAERFVADPHGAPGDRLYRSGDMARWLEDGSIDYLGRIDGQIKIRGHRVECGEIEARLLSHRGLRAAAVVARPDAQGQPRLVAYLVAREAPLVWGELRAHLATQLPEPMLPSACVWLEALPRTRNGKLDRAALPVPPRTRPELTQSFEAPRGAQESAVCAAFERVLEIDGVGRNDNFFDLGGDSLRVLRLLSALQPLASHKLQPQLLFDQPTPAALAAQLHPQEPSAERAQAPIATIGAAAQEPIAIIGMAGRFPGAGDVEQFWDNLLAGRDTISHFSEAELDPGVPAALRADPAYVRARGVVDGVEDFDAALFGISPKEAALTDPQHRLFLEICWECLERAGHAPQGNPAVIGVWGGMYNASYFQRHLSTRPDLVEALGEFQVMLANEKDYITTRVAHRLGLSGPAISVHTACSTSLVAVTQAFNALRAGQCDMALAGGASVTCPPRSGYLYQEGSMLSPDGRTRTFDAGAQGTVFSDGAAVVLLKRLCDAQADGDTIYAVLRGVAANNDGASKASFTAPSVAGQAQVIGAALAAAGVNARDISYVETHGTATPMGDPVEVEGLRRAFAPHTQERGFCAIGSLKSNVGHMVTAAGAAGLIKTALALHTGKLPASLHFEAPNPAIDFEATPFRVNDKLIDWPRAGTPRLAGVSAFGVGGTNAHVIVQEAPEPAASEPGEGPQLLQLSARTPSALAAACSRLADHLDAHPDISLADVAHTLRVGRTQFAQRACVVAESPAQAAQALRSADSPARASGATGARVPQPVFMFPGQGAQYAGMGQALYASGRAPRAAFDECLQSFEGLLSFDLRERMFSPDPAALAPTSVTQPATFTLEYVLATQMLSLGVQPVALVGHSVGEFAAAVLAGVMRLRDAARLVARRGELMQAQPAGAMLSVRLSAEQLLSRLPPTLSLAADNGPGACVAAGPHEEIERLRGALEADGVVARLLQTSHAFHSAMMEAAVPPFEALVHQIELSPPQRPIYSTLTGRLLSVQEATDPHYWARHLRETVRFSPAVRALMANITDPLFIELGPRNTLGLLVRQHGTKAQPANAISVLADKPEEEARAWRLAAGRLWTLGAEIDLAALDARSHKRRLCLPTYPFERKRLWVDIATTAAPAPVTAITPPTPAIPEPTMTAAPPATNADRRPALAQRLRTLFEDISGLDLADAEGATPFVEMGLDSLTLTQAALQVKKSFKVNLTFRQLMENYRSFDALGSFLDATLPPEPAVAAPVAAVAQPAPVAVPAAQAQAIPVMAAPALPAAIAMPAGEGSLVQQVIAQQMQLMQQQLALLSGAAAATAAPVQVQAVSASPAAAPVAAQATPAAPAAIEPTDAQGPMKYDVKKAFGAIARIHTQSKEMTERQKARLAAFQRRYVERTRKSKAFTAANRPHMADPRVVNGFRPATKEIVYQIVVERSKGSRVWDLDGNEYVDVLNGFGMNLFGWQPDFVQEAVREQLELGYEIGPQHPLAAEVTQLICEMTGFDRAALCNTGSESVMAAVRIARTVTGRNTVVLFTGSYHGTFDEVLVRAGRNAKGMPAAPGIMNGMFGDVRVLDYGTPEALEFIRANADDLAAVLVESVQSRRPDFQPREFLREVRAITENAGSCLIFDEVITGFRSHLRGAQAVFGIRADLACYGKVIGGGFPVGVIAGKREYMDALDGGAWQYGDDSVPTVGVTYFAGTFVRHPLALAACKASLTHLKNAGEALQTTLNLHTAAMADELSAFCREVGAPIEIRYFSSLWRVTWLEDHPLQDLLFAMMRSRGVHILDNFPCFMTTAHTQQDIALIKSAFKESVAEMQEAEFLPRLARNDAEVLDSSKPPVPGARLGRDANGKAAWFVPNPQQPGKYMLVR
ncbi:amino acid adenylation domain-containing protein [Variovorax sp. LARHSF232]